MEAGIIRRFYVDEMHELADAPLGLSIIHLVREEETRAPSMACDLIARAKTEIGDEALRADLIELIETVIVYKLPRLTREEIQAMLKVHDIRETRVYQEGMEKGMEKGKQAGRQEIMALAVAKLTARKMSVEDIAAILEVEVDLVRRIQSKGDGN